MAGAKRTIAVTGATGFVGTHVVERLLAEPELELRCLVRPTSDVRGLESMGPRVTLQEGDVCKRASLGELLRGASGVVNLAGYRDFWSRDRSLYYRLNHEGAENVFLAALEADVQKVVQVSTPLAFGVPAHVPFDEDTSPGPHPSDYARSKYLGDESGWKLYRERGLPLTVVHLAAVIGAGDPRPTMEVRRAVERRLPVLVGADTVYTYVYVRDAAEAIVRALLSPKSLGRRYLIGTERATTREYFTLIGKLADVPVPEVESTRNGPCSQSPACSNGLPSGRDADPPSPSTSCGLPQPDHSCSTEAGQRKSSRCATRRFAMRCVKPSRKSRRTPEAPARQS